MSYFYCPSVCLSIALPVCLSAWLFFFPPLHFFPRLSLPLSLSLSARRHHLSVWFLCNCHLRVREWDGSTKTDEEKQIATQRRRVSASGGREPVTKRWVVLFLLPAHWPQNCVWLTAYSSDYGWCHRFAVWEKYCHAKFLISSNRSMVQCPFLKDLKDKSQVSWPISLSRLDANCFNL